MRTLALAAVLALLAGCGRELVCPAGQTACRGRCVSLLTDGGNCGACGAAVGPLEVCVAGAPACAADVGVCGGTCTDLARDPASCGACGAACDPAAYCTTAAGVTGCADACPDGLAACGHSCVDLAADRFHCGACGSACAAGQACRDGACHSDLFVACYATNEVVPVTADLSPAGDPRATPAGPGALAVHGTAVYAANGYPAASVSVLPLDPALPGSNVSLAGSDLQAIGAHGGALLVTNAAIGTLVILSPAGDVLDEIPMPDQQSAPNPHGFAVAGTAAYVALYGSGPTSGQSIAKVDLSALPACVAGTAASCGALAGEIDLLAVPGSAGASALPFPSAALVAGGRVYVTLANLAEDDTPWGRAWVKPAGNGKLAVIDPSAGDEVSILDLPGCGNPGALALAGATLWVSCGSFSYPDLAPSALVPVDLAADLPAVGTPLALPAIIPGKVAFCGGLGYVTDQASGAVVRFAAATGAAEGPRVVCATGPYGYALASDIACSP